jgi:hypothetical protein
LLSHLPKYKSKVLGRILVLCLFYAKILLLFLLSFLFFCFVLNCSIIFDDVLEFANRAAFPATGEDGKIYVALDTNKTYRWGGTEYVEISAGLALGETQGTAYEGSKGKANADAIAELESDKADKVSGATNGNFAGLDANGDLTDSGSKASDFATAAQGTKADSAIQSVKVNGTALTPDANKAVDIEVPNRVTAEELAAFVV